MGGRKCFFPLVLLKSRLYLSLKTGLALVCCLLLSLWALGLLPGPSSFTFSALHSAPSSSFHAFPLVIVLLGKGRCEKTYPLKSFGSLQKITIDRDLLANERLLSAVPVRNILSI